MRQGAQRRFTPPGVASAVDELAQSLSYLEEPHPLRSDVHARSVLGLRPFRELRWRIRKLPKPRSSTLSPFDNASVMLSKIVLTIVSVSFLVRLETFETSSIRSAFVIVYSRRNSGVTRARSR